MQLYIMPATACNEQGLGQQTGLPHGIPSLMQLTLAHPTRAAAPALAISGHAKRSRRGTTWVWGKLILSFFLQLGASGHLPLITLSIMSFSSLILAFARWRRDVHCHRQIGIHRRQVT